MLLLGVMLFRCALLLLLLWNGAIEQYRLMSMLVIWVFSAYKKWNTSLCFSALIPNHAVQCTHYIVSNIYFVCHVNKSFAHKMRTSYRKRSRWCVSFVVLMVNRFRNASETNRQKKKSTNNNKIWNMYYMETISEH